MRLPQPSMCCIDAKVVADSNVQREKAVSAGRRFCVLMILSILLAPPPASSSAASYLETEQLFYSGNYQACLEVSLSEFNRGVWNDRWPQLALKCMLTTGRYSEARTTYEQAKKRFTTSIGLRALGGDVYRYCGDEDTARQESAEIVELVNKAPWRYSSSADLIVLGRFFVEQGEDARKVLELFYDRIKKNNSGYVPVYIASAELAISKYDFKLAAETLETAAKLQNTNPHIFYLQALAFQDSDRERASESLQRALELNPSHIPSLLLKAGYEIDSEQYSTADQTLANVLQINPWQPQAWSYHAVLAHLAGHYEGERALRNIALTQWKTNPNVDHWIGKKLSRKYRFREGAEYQRSALQFQPNFLPSRFQLAQDLLRLGDETNGWTLAKQVFDEDGYNVIAYNLVALSDELSRFATLQDERFLVRMDAREARIYGRRVLQLLNEAYDVLCAKYDVVIDGPVTVEIFPRQKDFAIRTFGLPGGDGFLGVCFGRVITANSPASQGNSPSNWQSVLWHEFCHVVTLEKTRNRMPRWLSEGISVYEERQRDDAWGERLIPEYHEMMLSDDLTPVSELSSAFLQPPSPKHLQFAYYQSSLVVEFLVQQHGFDTLKRILDDSAAGMPVNRSIERYTGSLAEFERSFATFAQETAKGLAPKLAFDRLKPQKGQPPSAEELAKFNARDDNYWALHFRSDRFLRDDNPEAARPLLEKLFQAMPNDYSSANAAVKLANVYRKLGLHDNERDMLVHVSRTISDALPAMQRLMELETQDGAWAEAQVQAERILAVQPLQPSPHRTLAQACRELGKPDGVVEALQALLEMDPTDPAQAHFELAQSLYANGDTTSSKRQVLMALEFAPRYQAALELLLQLNSPDQQEGRDDVSN